MNGAVTRRVASLSAAGGVFIQSRRVFKDKHTKEVSYSKDGLEYKKHLLMKPAVF